MGALKNLSLKSGGGGSGSLFGLDADFRVKWQLDLLEKQIQKGNRDAIGRSVRAVRNNARRGIRKSGKKSHYSRPGERPLGKTGNLRRSIRFKLGKTVGWVGATKPTGNHAPWLEHGFPTRKVAARPFMEPALQEERNTLLRFWKNKF